MATSTKDQLIRFRCECGKKLKATRDIIGRKVQCTQCPKIHRVPNTDRLGPKPTKISKLESKPAPAIASNSTEKNSTTVSQPTARKKKKHSNPTAASIQPSTQDEPQSVIAEEQPSLFINDELSAKEPSLLPNNDDSDSRFKLDPKFDPEPSEQLPEPGNSFEFDLADFDINTDASPKSDSRSPKPQNQFSSAREASEHANREPASFASLVPRINHTISKRTTLTGAAVVTCLLFLSTVGWFLLKEPSLPSEFCERPEVKNYVTKIQEFRKSQRELKIVCEAYVKSKSPPLQEREQIEAFNRSIQPLANKEEKLTQALELFQASQVEKARMALVTATKALDQKIPELQAKAKDFASKLR